ncbi:unnamed protein product [Plutella xylostella]|uniref:(diamondback moth) hypothetical protein n=1 Tax=Plutella xylostella TaxID=51655 RepID=A0A8S4FTR1_PLUXY|nr:unnamed protein product [Plutella xylostella]
MVNNSELTKKCFCARCFLPIDADDKVFIEGQNFHRMCSMCCICRTTPTSLKSFYGQMFCNECFKTHVISHFRSDSPRIPMCNWWMHGGPGCIAQEPAQEKKEECAASEDANGATKDEQCKKCFCARCLRMVEPSKLVAIGGQTFHPQCARCCCCQRVPTQSLKIYYGQVFCEECFQRHVMNRDKDHQSEFFKTCFEQWQNPAFAEQMNSFMKGNGSSPLIFMMQQGPSAHCRCGAQAQDWTKGNEPKKSAIPEATNEDSWDLSFEYRTDASTEFHPESHTPDESANKDETVDVAEKIEKLTKLLQETTVLNGEKCNKKWKKIFRMPSSSSTVKDCEDEDCWVNVQPSNTREQQDCPKYLWQCGVIYVNR